MSVAGNEQMNSMKIWREERLRERQKRSADIDALATRLYDDLNPNWEREIKVSKAECIRRMEERLRATAMLFR